MVNRCVKYIAIIIFFKYHDHSLMSSMGNYDNCQLLTNYVRFSKKTACFCKLRECKRHIQSDFLRTSDGSFNLLILAHNAVK